MKIKIEITISSNSEKTNINDIDEDYYSPSNIATSDNVTTEVDDDDPPPKIARYTVDDFNFGREK